MAITKLSRATLTQLRDDINRAFKDIENKYGVQIKTAGARFTATEANFKVQINTIDANGVVETSERSRFTTLAHNYDLEPEWLDQEFMHQGIRYKILGLNTRAKRYPVQVLRMDSKTAYKFPSKLVRDCMEKMLAV